MTSVGKPIGIHLPPTLMKAMKAPRKLPEMNKRVTRSHEMNQQLLAKENNLNKPYPALLTSVKMKTEPEEDTKPTDLPEHPEEQTKGKQPFNSPFLNVESAACAGEKNKFYTATLKLDEVLVVACTSLRTLMKVTTLISCNMDSEVIKIETCEKETKEASSNEESFSSSTTDSLNKSGDGRRKYSTNELVRLASHTLCQRYPTDWDKIAEKFPEIVSKDPQYFNPSDYESVQFTNLFEKPFYTNKTVCKKNYRPATISDSLKDRRYIPVNNPSLMSMLETEDVSVQPTTTNKPPASRLPHPSSLYSQSRSEQTNAVSKNHNNHNNHSSSSSDAERWQNDHYVQDNSPKKIVKISENKPQQISESKQQLTGRKMPDNVCLTEENLWQSDKFVENKSPNRSSKENFKNRSPCSMGFLKETVTSKSEEKSPKKTAIGFEYRSPQSEGLFQETVASKLELYKNIAESRNKNISRDSFSYDKLSKTTCPVEYPSSDGMVNQPNFYGGQFINIMMGKRQKAANVNNNDELWLDSSDISDISVGDYSSLMEPSSRDFVPREHYNKFITEDITEYGLVNDPLRTIDTNRYM